MSAPLKIKIKLSIDRYQPVFKKLYKLFAKKDLINSQEEVSALNKLFVDITAICAQPPQQLYLTKQFLQSEILLTVRSLNLLILFRSKLNIFCSGSYFP